MPTIIYVHEIGEGGEVTPTYVNADQIRRVYTSSRLHLTLFADGSAMLTQESPDEIAALIAERMNPLLADYKLPEWAREREADLPEDTNVVPLPKLKPVMPEDNIARAPGYEWPDWERNLGSGIVPGTPKE